MKVKDLIEKLSEYNQEAEIYVVAHCRPFNFSLSYGSSEGCTKQNCENVSLYVDNLCVREKEKCESELRVDDSGVVE